MQARRFAATIAYDGTEFAGSQLQRGQRTIQSECESALGRLFGEPVRMAFAGRTDAGVHARGQVGSFAVATALDAATIERACNALLPEAIAVRGLRCVDAAFDPRRWALSRWYRYCIQFGPVRDPLAIRYAWFAGVPLDAGAMQTAADAIIGTHDFAACSGRVPPERSTIRTITSARWSESEGCCIFDIEGNAFLPHMVRMLVGAMARVGRGQLSANEFIQHLRAAQQGTLGPAAPARGLSLMQVRYDRGYLP